MYKRLLALLLFIPMFLLAWYARNSRQPGLDTGNSHVARQSEQQTTDESRRQRDRRYRDGDRQYRDDDRQDGPQDRQDGYPERQEHRYDSRDSARDQASNQPGAFDFYLLNLSWSPEFCSTHPGKPECAASPGFVLHGLWPQNNNGSYPEHCSNAPGPADARVFADIYPDAGLLEHEWSTHGTCSGLSPDAFFSRARKAVQSVRIPTRFTGLGQQTSATPDDILSQFASANPSIPRDSLALSCGNNYLTAVEVCLDHNLQAIACNSVRSCRANSVRIVPPGKGAH